MPVMDVKTLNILEYHKVLRKVEANCGSFVAQELVQNLKPTHNADQAALWIRETSEARQFLAESEGNLVGGVFDIRDFLADAQRGKILQPADVQDIKATLLTARDVARVFNRSAENYPSLATIAARIPTLTDTIQKITEIIDEKGEIKDSASPQLASIRKAQQSTHSQLSQKAQQIISNKNLAPHIQDAIITQRDGRIVIPVRAESKGRIKGIIHDSSSSGATLFIEPESLVELNNKIRKLQLEERDEILRLMILLTDHIKAHHEDILLSLNTVAHLDMILAKGKYANQIEATEPALIEINDYDAEENTSGITIQLNKARHPLIDPKQIVPIDVVWDESTFMMVITGPNTGGKTVTLKTIGLLSAMAQSGLHIPCQAGSKISLFKNIYADIGDEQSIEQSLSTFSGHVKNIIRIIDKADHHSMILFDELASGTDPQEGAALARAIMNHLVREKVTSVIATHYPSLKSFAQVNTGVINASVEFNTHTLRPTYRLLIGMPGRSNALAIAKRLGLQEDIIADAESVIDPNELRAEDLLEEVQRLQKIAKKERNRASRARRKADQYRAELKKQLGEFEEERQTVLEKELQEAQQEMQALKKEMAVSRRNLELKRKPTEQIDELESKINTYHKKIQKTSQEIATDATSPTDPNDFRNGDLVHIKTYQKEGTVSGVFANKLEVLVGTLRLRVNKKDVELIKRKQKQEEKIYVGPKIGNSFSYDSPGFELNLIGMTVDEGLEKLERHLDAAYVAHLPFVRIVHGKGTGRLRSAVRQFLHNHAYIQSYQDAQQNEGGDGATIAYLVE